MTTITPLRYPGGKSKLLPFVKNVIELNGLVEGHYVEPYAGGAGVALGLLRSGHASHVHINDLNDGIYAFWHSVFNAPDELSQLVTDTPVTMETWHRQKAVFADRKNHTMLENGFATFFLNRTNRSGILSGGVIGGKEQLGKWKIDARFNAPALVDKIQWASTLRDDVTLHNEDAELLLKRIVPTLPRKSLIFLDPPYYVKSDRLYDNPYTHADHERIARFVSRLQRAWIISYDDVPSIRELYSRFHRVSYELNYSAAESCIGAEIMFAKPGLRITRAGVDRCKIGNADFTYSKPAKTLSAKQSRPRRQDRSLGNR